MTRTPVVAPTGRDTIHQQAGLACDPRPATSINLAPGAITNPMTDPVDGFPSPAPDSGEGFSHRAPTGRNA